MMIIDAMSIFRFLCVVGNSWVITGTAFLYLMNELYKQGRAKKMTKSEEIKILKNKNSYLKKYLDNYREIVKELSIKNVVLKNKLRSVEDEKKN